MKSIKNYLSKALLFSALSIIITSAVTGFTSCGNEYDRDNTGTNDWDTSETMETPAPATTTDETTSADTLTTDTTTIMP